MNKKIRIITIKRKTRRNPPIKNLQKTKKKKLAFIINRSERSLNSVERQTQLQLRYNTDKFLSDALQTTSN